MKKLYFCILLTACLALPCRAEEQRFSGKITITFQEVTLKALADKEKELEALVKDLKGHSVNISFSRDDSNHHIWLNTNDQNSYSLSNKNTPFNY